MIRWWGLDTLALAEYLKYGVVAVATSPHI